MFGWKIEALGHTIGKEPDYEKIIKKVGITPLDSGKKAIWTSIFGDGQASIAHHGKIIRELWERVNPNHRLSSNLIIGRR